MGFLYSDFMDSILLYHALIIDKLKKKMKWMQAFKYKISWRLKHMKHSSETLQLDEKGSNPYIFLVCA